MPLSIAFLRAINVGGRTVRMQQLREVFEALGLARVETFIASGNVVFEPPDGEARDAALEGRIERGLREALGYEVATFLRSAGEVAEIAEHRPFEEFDPGAHVLSVAFLKAPPEEEAVRRLLRLRTELDDLCVRRREVYWLCRSGRTSDSTVSGAALERALGMPATVRGLGTVRRLTAKYPPGP